MSHLNDLHKQFERGRITEADAVKLFQFLVDSRAVYSLDRRYLEHAQYMATKGAITMPGVKRKSHHRGIIITLVVLGMLIALPFLFLALVHSAGI